MKTTPDTQTDATGSTTNGAPSTVQVDPSLLAEADAAKTKVDGAPVTDDAGKTAEIPVQPAAAAAGNPGDGGATQPGASDKDDDEPQLPVGSGKGLKYGLIAAAVLGVIALFAVAFAVVRNNATTSSSPTVAVPSPSPAVPAAPVAPLSTLPEVRTPAPRLIDASGCRRGQYRIEGNQLVFTNCATLELAEPPAR